METPKEYHYTYYSYEEWGRGYFGSRTCKCLPEEDIKYFGSSKDKTFKPTQKIILKDDYPTREEAYADEIILQQYYKVVENPHFTNRAYQTSTKFYYIDGSVGGKKAKELGVGIHALTTEQRRENGRKGGKLAAQTNMKNKTACFSLTPEQRSEVSRRVGKKYASLVNSQRWECCETGYVSTAAGVVNYQKARGIDTSKNNRKRIS